LLIDFQKFVFLFINELEFDRVFDFLIVFIEFSDHDVDAIEHFALLRLQIGFAWLPNFDEEAILIISINLHFAFLYLAAN
jgi:hypothetical protein